MIWKGKALVTFGEIADAVAACATPAEAQEFMTMYRAETQHADANVGYLSGYFDQATRHRIQEWCGVAHPIFGRSDPTPEEAFAAGVRMGTAARNSAEQSTSRDG